MTSKFNLTIAIASIAAILLHLFIKLTSADIFIQNSPLWAIILIGGIPLLATIITKAFKLDLGADLLAAIALILAVYLKEYIAANLIILMLASGQYLEEYAAAKASFVLKALAGRMPNIAHLKINDEIKNIDISAIKIGDLIAIYPHETCPIDGVILEGYGSMDESYLTGEPYHISKAPGSQVLSGAINGESLIIVQATKLAKDSRYSNIIKVIEDAEKKRPNIRRLGDKIGAIFAPVALIFAIAVLFFTGDVTRFLSILVVATPCPLLIAIPITIISAISIAAKNGIIIKDPAVLENLPICSTAIFDKTGTLTYGKPELIKIVTFNNFEENKILQIVASIENYSRHPLANAIIKKSEERNLTLLNVENIFEKAGQGLIAHVFGQEILVTNRKRLFEIDQNLTIDLPEMEHGLECVILSDNKLAAIFNFRDTPRNDGHSFIHHLAPNHHFKRIMLVSGDRDSEVKYLANLFGIENTFASQTPEQKLEIVRAEVKKAPTLFMGDGINDAPALTSATVGIAFGENSGVVSESSGAVIMEHSLAKVDELLHISEAMRRIALQSAIGGMIFSFGGMILAAMGMINPIQGALLQEAIDVVAILNALRLTWQKDIGADIK